MKNVFNNITNRSKALSITEDRILTREHPCKGYLRQENNLRVSALINFARRKSEPVLRTRSKEVVLISAKLRGFASEDEALIETSESLSTSVSSLSRIEEDCSHELTSDCRRFSCPPNLQDARKDATTICQFSLKDRSNSCTNFSKSLEEHTSLSNISAACSSCADSKRNHCICNTKRVAVDPARDSVASKVISSRSHSLSLRNMRFTTRRPSKLGVNPRKWSLPNLNSSSEGMEAVKKTMSSTGSLRRRKKSYECQKRATEMSGGQTEHDGMPHPQDFKLDREVVPGDPTLDSDFSFTKNVWYYGELEVVHGYRRNLCQKYAADDFRGYMVARIDCTGDIAYTITYRAGEELFVGEIPYHEGKYCLDFSDPDKPKFSCVKYLIADMIQGKFLQRVTFNWLLDNLII